MDAFSGCRRLLTILAIVAVAALAFSPTPAAAQSVATDRLNYDPDEAVTIVGWGWQPYEFVSMVITDTSGTKPAVSIEATADAGGNFVNTDFFTQQSDLGLMFALTALGSSGAEAMTAFKDGTAPGSLNCPTLTRHNRTHYKLPVGTTVTCTIDGATDLSANQQAGTDPTEVLIKSSALGNFMATNVSVSGTTITFTWTAPTNGCQTTIVSYGPITVCRTNPQGQQRCTTFPTEGNDANNDILADGVKDGVGGTNQQGQPLPLASAGFAYVDRNGDVISCAANVTTEIHTDNPDQAVISVSSGTSVHDKATVTKGSGIQSSFPDPTGNVTFTFYADANCGADGGTAFSAGTVSLTGSPPMAHPSSSFVVTGPSSFKAHYNGDDNYAQADSTCESLAVALETGSLTACKFRDDDVDGVNAPDPADPPLSGWSMTINPATDAMPSAIQQTGDDGCVTWTNLTTGTYTVTEAPPSGGNPWFNTKPGNNNVLGAPCLISGSSTQGWPTCAPQQTAMVTAPGTAMVEFGNVQSATKSGQKWYDINTNGQNEVGFVTGEVGIQGWKITLSSNGPTLPPNLSSPQFTNSSGNYKFEELLPGNYTVSEVFPPNSTYLPTTATSIPFTLDPTGENETGNDFGNVCVGAGGGLTLGFWTNRNGQALLMSPDFTALNLLHLRNANGTDRDFLSTLNNNKSALRSWLLNATATNMAYMLSAQLATMKLNVLHGFVNGSSLIYAPGTTSANLAGFATVNAIMAEADLSLTTFNITIDGGIGSAERPHQTALKNALDRANNNLNFVQPMPCAFTTPY